MQSLSRLLAISLALLIPASFAAAEDHPSFTIVYKDGGFDPKTLGVPADTKVELQVDNQSAAAIEFESHDMKAEKIIKAGKKYPVMVGPLKPGTYSFFNEFKESDTGTVTVK